MGLKCLYWTMGRTERTVPPKPAISPPKNTLVPLFGEIALLSVLKEKLGTTLLVMIPSKELGPLMPRNARSVNRIFEASLTATMEERSKEYVRPTRLNEWCS